MKKIFALTVVLMFVCAAWGAGQASAATFTVVNTNDAGAGSLRQAILDANANNQEDTINFDATVFGTPQTIVLTTGQLVVAADNSSGSSKILMINGPGANLLTISGNNQSRVMSIEFFARAIINGVKITGGNGIGGDNFQNLGGGLLVKGGFQGEGVRSLILTNSIIIGNKTSAPGNGGGISLMTIYVTIINSTIADNESQQGAGIYIAPNCYVRLINSTVSSNRAGISGGGIYNNGGSIYSTNSTIAFNHGSAEGGGITQASSPNIFSFGYLRNTILAHNTVAGPGNIGPDARGGFNSLGYNIVSNSNGLLFYPETTLTGNQMNVDPRLDNQLRTNGGAIPHHALRANSTAIDAGDNCVLTLTASGGCADDNTPVITTDLRGVTRPQDGDGNGTATVDVGAFEATRPEVASAPTAAPDLQAANDTGASATDNITSSSTLNFDVAGLTVGATVELLRNGVPVASATAAGSSMVLTDNNATANGVHVYATRQVINNVTSLQGPSVSVTIDNIAPAVTLNQASFQVDPTNAQPINYTVAFSEPVADFVPADVSLAGSTAGISTATIAVSGSGAAYVIGVINLSADGTIVASIPQGAAHDVAGNANQASTSTDNVVTYDTTRPTVTINQAAAQTDPARTLPINFTVVFSEPVNGFTSADVSLSGTAVNVGSAVITITGSGTTYNVAVSNLTSNGGFIRASIAANTVSDGAGNLSVASTSTDNQVTLDNVAPTVTVNQASGQSDPTSLQPVNFTVTFSEAVTGFTAADISFVGSTAGVNFANVIITGSGGTYNVSISNITTSGLVRVSVLGGAAQDFAGNQSLASTSTDNTVTVTAKRYAFDYDGDGRADLSVFRPSTSTWHISNSSNGALVSVQFGAAGDLIAPADFDGDGKTDICVFRPSDGAWYRLNSLTNTFTPIQFGANGDLPVPGDFDGDGKADLAVYRHSAGSWYRLNSSNNQFVAAQFGIAEDKPLVGDFDGDRKADLAVFRPSNGTWYRINSATDTLSAAQFGAPGDLPVAADYDGDARTDLAVYRPSVGDWYIINSTNSSFTGIHFGVAEDNPAPADFDGDGKADLVVFRPSSGTWYLLRTTAGFTGFQFGASGDVPTPGAFVR